jgi:hypothetical protein
MCGGARQLGLWRGCRSQDAGSPQDPSIGNETGFCEHLALSPKRRGRVRFWSCLFRFFQLLFHYPSTVTPHLFDISWLDVGALEQQLLSISQPSPKDKIGASGTMANKKDGRNVTEKPDIEKDALAEPEPVQQRTVAQQKKLEARVAQNRRAEGLESNRSRSSSRRERRKRIQQAMDEGKFMKTNSLEALEEADANGELQAMQMFERIGPDSTSMDGPVTYARAMRGEIPVRGSNPNQPYYMTPEEPKGVSDLLTIYCCGNSTDIPRRAN